jgi:hypothetical protein
MPKTETSKMQQPEPSLPPAGNKDKVCYGISVSCLVSGVITTVWMWYTIITTSIRAFNTTPTEWWSIAGMALLAVGSFFIARFFLWLSILAPLMLAAQTRSYEAQEKFCNLAMRFRQFLPGGATWASHGLMQLMLQRKQFNEAIALGSREYDYAIKKNPKDQSLAPMCAQIALAFQLKSDNHGCILWNERAVEAFGPLLENMEKQGQKKGKFVPEKQFVDQARMQLAGIFCNLATTYLNVGNYGKAKSNYARATEQALKLPDSTEKQQILQISKEQSARLKHW